MKPLAIDFSPRPSPRHKAAWLAGGAGIVATALAGAAWLLTAPVEASRMNDPVPHAWPQAEEVEAIDAAIGALNRPWLAVIDALAASCGHSVGILLTGLESDARQSILRIAGKARDAAAVQALPGRLRGLPAIAEVRLLGQEPQEEDAAYPVRFTLELRWQEVS